MQAIDVFQAAYCDGIETTVEQVFERVAKKLAKGDIVTEEKFYNIMLRGCTPAGRILATIGTKKNTSAINCAVSQSIEDDMTSIMSALFTTGLTLKAGIGIGFEFSKLRPKGSFIGGTSSVTNGPISFMEAFNSLCWAISASGGRRGAMMATFAVNHPDIFDFIAAKVKPNSLSQFNLSVLITDKFMQAVQSDTDITFAWSHKLVRAKSIWDSIMEHNYHNAEPGILFIDTINHYNILNWCETITATNPCGEQPLPSNGTCLLGSIILPNYMQYVKDKYVFNFDLFEKDAGIFTELLDNVVEFSNLPNAQFKSAQLKTRRHGMGITGFGTACNMLGVRYGSEKSLAFLEQVLMCMHRAGWEQAIELSKKKGMAPIFANSQNRLATVKTPYFQKTLQKYETEFLKYGFRFSHHLSIAPTATISLTIGGNCSSGIEPTYSLEQDRILKGVKTRLLARELCLTNVPMFETVDTVGILRHLLVQSTAQDIIDSSISKTINLPQDVSRETFDEIYRKAWSMGLKGLTTYRDNCRENVISKAT